MSFFSPRRRLKFPASQLPTVALILLKPAMGDLNRTRFQLVAPHPSFCSLTLNNFSIILAFPASLPLMFTRGYPANDFDTLLFVCCPALLRLPSSTIELCLARFACRKRWASANVCAADLPS